MDRRTLLLTLVIPVVMVELSSNTIALSCETEVTDVAIDVNSFIVIDVALVELFSVFEPGRLPQNY